MLVNVVVVWFFMCLYACLCLKKESIWIECMIAGLEIEMKEIKECQSFFGGGGGEEGRGLKKYSPAEATFRCAIYF